MTNEQPAAEQEPTRLRRVTHDDIAKASGVSRATVSYVLNNAEGRVISQGTRELVQQTAQRLGHVPFAPARSLRLGRSNIVLALVRDFSFGYVSNRVLRALDVALAERGYVVLVHQLDENLRSLMELWGLVSPTLVVAMGGLTLPQNFVVDEARTKIVRVHGMVHQADAGEMQAQHLYDKGHRVLGYAYPKALSVRLIADERLDGFRRECERLGLAEPVICEVDTDDPATVFDAIESWNAADSKPTAVATHNDEIGIMVQAAMSARGLRVPDDLAVIGVDNIPSARISLTTVAIDIDKWARDVVSRVQDSLDDKTGPVPDHRDYLRLIVRDST